MSGLKTWTMIGLAWLLTVGHVSSCMAEELDRVIAVVNGRAITWSAALEEANSEEFMAGRPPLDLRLTEAGALERLRGPVERLADRMAMERAWDRSGLGAEAFSNAAQNQLAGPSGAWEQISGSYSSPTEMAASLQRYGLDESILRSRIRRQLQLLAFIDYSLRPQVQIGSDAVAEYYRNELLEQFRQAQPTVNQPPLEDVRARIEEILVQREISRLMGPWLEGLKREYGFRWLPPMNGAGK